MWLIFYKPTQVIIHPTYQRYYASREDAMDAIDHNHLEPTDCIVCPAFEMHSFATPAREEARQWT